MLNNSLFYRVLSVKVLPSTNNGNCIPLKSYNMSKSQDTKKSVKKEPAKTAKEKKAAKRDKKSSKSND